MAAWPWVMVRIVRSWSGAAVVNDRRVKAVAMHAATEGSTCIVERVRAPQHIRCRDALHNTASGGAKCLTRFKLWYK